MSYLRSLRSSYPKIRYLGYFLIPLCLTLGLRVSGASKQWDLLALDLLLRMRPAESIDNRITIVTIDETDLAKLPDRNSIPDRTLADAIDRIAAAKASVIGVDLIRDGAIDPQLIAAYQQHKNVIGLAKILPPDELAAPRGLPPDRIGFGDYEPDLDGAVRRATLAVFQKDRSPLDLPKYSFAFQIARLYLSQHSSQIQIDPDRLNLGLHSIYPLENSNSSDRSKYFDIIINYRQVYPAFRTVKLADLLAGKISNLDRQIVLIGYTATTKQDFVNTQVIHNPEINGNIYGVEYHAQIVSQLVTTALNERSSIQPVPMWGECLWISIATGGMRFAIFKLKFNTKLWQILVSGLGYFTSIALSICLLFSTGWWLSIGFTFSAILIVYIPVIISFYQRELALLTIDRQRSQAIAETFNAIHNGPLQELSLLLQAVRSESISLPEIDRSLGNLNQQIRTIGEALQTNIVGLASPLANRAAKSSEILVLGNGDRLDLNMPFNEILYLVADKVIYSDRHPSLSNLKIKIIDFQEVPNDRNLNVDLQRQLCQFLEEAIGNVDKYAQSATKLQLIGKVFDDVYRLSIENNGCGQISSRIGSGTKQAQLLAKSLNGKFQRSSNSTGDGVICSIEWNVKSKF
jgi:CHASE2 domain-containing sensor protein